MIASAFNFSLRRPGKFWLVLPLLLALVCPVPAPESAQAAAPAGKKGEVTRITADSMVYDSNRRRVTFHRRVKVTQPDFELTSDSLELYLSGSSRASAGKSQSVGGMEAGQVEKIVARDNVVIKLPDGRLATCGKATYTTADEVVLMENNPALNEDGNTLRADRIYFYMRDNRSQAQGNVKVDFTSKGDNKPDFLTPKN